MINGLAVPDASENVEPLSVEYWYLVNVGVPPVDPVNATLIDVVDPFTGETLVITGTDPILFVVTEDDADELADVQADPDNALKITVYAVPAVNPVIIIGLLVPDASEKVDPLSVEY